MSSAKALPALREASSHRDAVLRKLILISPANGTISIIEQRPGVERYDFSGHARSTLLQSRRMRRPELRDSRRRLSVRRSLHARSPSREGRLTDTLSVGVARAGNPAIQNANASGPEALRPRLTAGLRKLPRTIAPAGKARQLYEGGDKRHPNCAAESGWWPC